MKSRAYKHRIWRCSVKKKGDGVEYRFFGSSPEIVKARMFDWMEQWGVGFEDIRYKIKSSVIKINDGETFTTGAFQ